MKVITANKEIYDQVRRWKDQGHKVALVPTMGCLHQGHLSLVRQARELADRVIVSVFVNPMQFGPNEDFDAYPRQFKADCDLAEREGADLIFSPKTEEMYTSSFQTTISVKSLSLGMCGGDRPGHFDGVATVVTKLLNITQPDIAVFGEKDFQQLAVIRQLVVDLNLPVEIVGGAIVREEDGLAMSSRNKYLEGENRTIATCLSQAIFTAKKRIAESGDGTSAQEIINQTKEIVATAGAKLEYAVVVNGRTLESENIIGPESVLALAAKIDNKVRLIDNAKLCE